MACKVCRVLEKYNCEYYDDKLVKHWTAPKPERKGYRQLSRWLNVNLLRQEMDRAGLTTLAGEAESKYDRLQTDSSVAAELRDDLRSQGVTIDELVDDFVSYGVVRRHLLECLGAERESTSTDWEREAIRISLEHATDKITDATRSLANKGKLGADRETTLHVDAEIECEECHVRVSLERALRRGYICACSE